MARFWALQTNFTSGWLSRSAEGRTDLARYFNGVRELKNYVITKRGGIIPRPGAVFVTNTKDQDVRTRLFAFIFSTDIAYIIEAGDEYMRFYRDDALISFELTTPYAIEDLANVRIVQAENTMILVHPDYPPQRLTRVADDLWRISEIQFNLPALAELGVKPDTDLALSGMTGSITLTTTDPTFLLSDVGREVEAGAGLARISAFTSTTSVDAEVVIEFDDTAYATSLWTLLDSPQTALQPNKKDVGDSVNLVTTDNAWRDSSYSFTDVGRYVRVDEGLVKIDSVSDEKTAVGTVIKQLTKDADVTTSIPDKAFPGGWSIEVSQWSDELGYPKTVGIFEGRLIFGGSPSFPNRIWGSDIANKFNFFTALNDSDPFQYDISSDRFDEITAIESAKQLLVLTKGSEYAVNGRNDGPVAPTNTAIRRQSTYGSKSIEPTSLQNGIAFVHQDGKQVLFYAFQAQIDGFDGVDTTSLNDEILDNGVTAVSFAQSPHQHLFCSTDGKLAILCIETSEGIFGWSSMEGGGGTTFYDVATIPANGKDQTWVIAQINGQYAVCRLSYDSSLDGEIKIIADNPTTEWSGLDHLANSVVDVLLDEQPIMQLPVNNDGELVTPIAGQILQAGYFFESDCMLLPVEQSVGGSMQGRQACVSKVYIKVLDTQCLAVNGDNNPMRIFGDEILDQKITPVTTDINMSTNGWGPSQTTVRLQRLAPLKQTILSVNRVTSVND